MLRCRSSNMSLETELKSIRMRNKDKRSQEYPDIEDFRHRDLPQNLTPSSLSNVFIYSVTCLLSETSVYTTQVR